MKFKNAATCGAGSCPQKSGVILQEMAAASDTCLIVGIVLRPCILGMSGYFRLGKSFIIVPIAGNNHGK